MSKYNDLSSDKSLWTNRKLLQELLNRIPNELMTSELKHVIALSKKRFVRSSSRN